MHATVKEVTSGNLSFGALKTEKVGSRFFGLRSFVVWSAVVVVLLAPGHGQTKTSKAKFSRFFLSFHFLRASLLNGMVWPRYSI